MGRNPRLARVHFRHGTLTASLIIRAGELIRDRTALHTALPPKWAVEPALLFFWSGMKDPQFKKRVRFGSIKVSQDALAERFFSTAKVITGPQL